MGEQGREMATRRRSGRAALALILALAGSVATSSLAGADGNKTFQLSVNPSEVGAGATEAVTLTIDNDAETQRLGSVDVVVPDELVIEEIRSTSLGTATLAGTSPQVIQLRDLDLAPGGSATVEVVAHADCVTAGPVDWDAVGKQANDFNGEGNDFTPASAVTTITGSCALRFEVQPANAENVSVNPEAVITGTAYDAGGPAVAVVIEDASGDPLRWRWLDSIDLGLGVDNSGGTAVLDGTVSAIPDPVTATATFAPTLDVSADGYTLVAATAPVVASAESVSFTIVDDADRCGPSNPSGRCRARSSRNGTTAEVTAEATDAAAVLEVSIDAADSPVFACGDYEAASGTVEFFVSAETGDTKTVSITIDAALVDRPPNKYDACFASPDSFEPKRRTTLSTVDDPAVGLLYVGLLPDCGRTPVAPCVFDRSRDRATGAVTVSFYAPGGDPWGRI